MGSRRQNVGDRLERHSSPEPTTGCWLWTGSTTPKGYGHFNVSRDGRLVQDYAHRVAWAQINGPVPSGLFVCHRCDTPSCVNPNHLFLGTAKDNSQDMIKKGRQATVFQAAPIPESVAEIRSRRAAGERGSDLAREFGLSQAMISLIANNKRWKAA